MEGHSKAIEEPKMFVVESFVSQFLGFPLCFHFSFQNSTCIGVQKEKEKLDLYMIYHTSHLEMEIGG